MHKERNYNLVNYMCVIAALNNMQLKWKYSLAGELETTMATIVQDANYQNGKIILKIDAWSTRVHFRN